MFIFNFFNFKSSFFENISHCNISLDRGCSTIPNLLFSCKHSKGFYCLPKVFIVSYKVASKIYKVFTFSLTQIVFLLCVSPL